MFKKVISWLKDEKITKQDFYYYDGVIYPTKELIIIIHDLLIDHFKGKDDGSTITKGQVLEGNIDYLIDHIVKKYNHLYRGEERIYKKATYLMHYLFTAHCFTDGNKRTGIVITVLFLLHNLGPTKEKIINYKKNVNIFKKLASYPTNDKKGIKKVYEWLKNNARN